MDLRQLESFRVTLALGSQRAAAAALARAPSTITLHLQQLEAELGGPLFERRRGRIELTARGTALHRHVAVITKSLADLADEVAADSPQSGTLALGCVEPAAHHQLVPLLAELYRHRPAITLEITIAGTRQLSSAVDDGALPLAIATPPPSHPRLTFERLYQEALSVVVPVRHPLVRRQRVHQADLAAETLVLGEPDCAYRGAAEQAIATAIRDRRVRAQIGSVPSIVAAVRQGFGIAILPGSWLAGPQVDVTTVPLSDAHVDIGVITGPATPDHGLYPEFLRTLRAHTGVWTGVVPGGSRGLRERCGSCP